MASTVMPPNGPLRQRGPLPWEDGAPVPQIPPKPSPNIAEEVSEVPLEQLALKGKRSMPGISLRAFILGCTFSTGATFAASLLLNGTPLWRPFFFLAALSFFHFLEFWTTATFNPPRAYATAFLLSSNGSAYQTAHFLSFLESTVVSAFFPGYQARVSSNEIRALGVGLVLMGQAIRTAAMATAGTNFNHFVQMRKAKDHVLVTDGVYRFLRHPSYFGFFWWAIGTQMVLGNVGTGIGFVVALWYFFKRRIPVEEDYLYAFFGDEYKDYSHRSWIGIPFVRGTPKLRKK